MHSTAPSLTIIDNRTGQQLNVPIEDGTIAATAFANIKTDGGELHVFDGAYQNTAVVRSEICFIDGERGILEYRGYPIQVLAERSTFLEVAYLLIYGELPMPTQYEDWKDKVMNHTFIHTRLAEMMKTFNYDAHPMSIFISAMAAMSSFHASANPALQGADLFVNNKVAMNNQIIRILGKAPTVAAAAYRHRIGRPYNLPQNHLDYAENFLFMMDRLDESNYHSHPVLKRALDIMFILHADHEMNCSTAAMCHIGSSRTDPYSAIAGAAAALYGPLHGGANEAVLHMLEEIGTVENVPSFIEEVKSRKKRLMGFGHRIYRNYDPRAKIIRKVAHEVFQVCGREPMIDIAIALEKTALADEYFVERSLYPNVDFYSGLIYKAMGFPTDFFPVLFAIPRIVGWLAHWKEMMEAPQPKIWRPRQVYVGKRMRDYVPMEVRETSRLEDTLKVDSHPYNRRYIISTRSKL